jgi:hypothetical protein
MDAIGRFVLVVALVISVGTAIVARDPPPKDAAFAEQLRGLDPVNDKAGQLRTLRWISQHANDTNAAQAIAALERCLRDDPTGEVRQRAVAVLSQLAKRVGQPCPLAIINALDDSVAEVRYAAATWAGRFKTFAPGSAEILLRGVKADNAELRSTSLLLLARAAGRDPKALDAMQKARKDNAFEVRHNAHIALFLARNQLAEHLPYLIRVREDAASILTPDPADSDVAKQERVQLNLIRLGIAG